MKNRILSYFSPFEIGLWCGSVLFTVTAFLLFDRGNFLMLAACVIGATYLIFNAKGNPFGQVLAVLFSLLYGYISYTFSYYGEMLTYLGMSAPMAVYALISWLRHPHAGNHSEVQTAFLTRRDLIVTAILTAAVTFVSYFVLRYFGTANLLPSTLSVATSFAAVYLMYLRSRYFTVAYALNDAVLIVLWGLAALTDTHYIPVVINFAMFLVNDLYSFLSWTRMEHRQATVTER